MAERSTQDEINAIHAAIKRQKDGLARMSDGDSDYQEVDVAKLYKRLETLERRRGRQKIGPRNM